MNEQERELVETVGCSVEEARARLRDDDLWLVNPEMRLGLRTEEEIEQMRRAVLLRNWPTRCITIPKQGTLSLYCFMMRTSAPRRLYTEHASG